MMKIGLFGTEPITAQLSFLELLWKNESYAMIGCYDKARFSALRPIVWLRGTKINDFYSRFRWGMV